MSTSYADDIVSPRTARNRLYVACRWQARVDNLDIQSAQDAFASTKYWYIVENNFFFFFFFLLTAVMPYYEALLSPRLVSNNSRSACHNTCILGMTYL